MSYFILFYLHVCMGKMVVVQNILYQKELGDIFKNHTLLYLGHHTLFTCPYYL